MATKTEIIKFNLKERGRQHRGQPRNFNIPVLCAVINGPELQERVKNRDLLGYRGHWPRIAFGMNPEEGGIKGGRVQNIEPALVTTYLRAFPDGTIEHQAEFLDTPPGQIAARMYASRVGGFSSAIDNLRPEFFGFDYVNEPNYTTNRGFSLDSVFDTGVTLDSVGLSLDSVYSEIERENASGVVMLLDSATAACVQMAEALECATLENDQLLDMLAKAGLSAPSLDSVASLPVVASAERANRMILDAAEFRTAELPGYVPLPKEAREVEQDSAYSRLRARVTGGY